MEVDLDWHTVTPYHSLVVIFKVIRVFPDLGFGTRYRFVAGYSRAAPPPFWVTDRTTSYRL